MIRLKVCRINRSIVLCDAVVPSVCVCLASGAAFDSIEAILWASPMSEFRIETAFLAPALADFALAGIQVPEMMTRAPEIFLPRALVCAIALSWGVLLIVARMMPRQRSWVLPPTMLVVALIGAANVAAFVRGSTTSADLLVALVVCSVLVGLCLSGWIRLRAPQPG